ncbi:HNH endonuclease [Microbacterium invictum]|uniref:HNH endonuclease n=1 Tax=Microbacterium invictum TaxID=515415 RepID=A0ABZ0VDB3_9MICO|nr:HNH endonuclease [Microbacterium invictum]WQB71605.1 HNH endonuclease [Microbacterium invictum]
MNGIIPVIWPTAAQVEEALNILGMPGQVLCAYCGDPSTEWDHLRPLVVNQQPTGYISEIHNLVPACGKCNQSKGNSYWYDWLFGAARLSPTTRGVPGLDERAERLRRYEQWGTPTRVDFLEVVGDELWNQHWRNHAAILELMRDAESTVAQIRDRIASSGSVIEPPPTAAG